MLRQKRAEERQKAIADRSGASSPAQSAPVAATPATPAPAKPN
jgi:hypothetical protein